MDLHSVDIEHFNEGTDGGESSVCYKVGNYYLFDQSSQNS